MKIMYRTEAFSGQMIYDVCDVVRFETFELGNSDILETLLSNGLIKDRNLHNLAWVIAETSDGYRRSELMSEEEEREFVEHLIAEMLDEYDYEAYEVGPVVLSDLDDMGKLFGYAELPCPLAPDDYPGGVKKPLKLSKKLLERRREVAELRGA